MLRIILGGQKFSPAFRQWREKLLCWMCREEKFTSAVSRNQIICEYFRTLGRCCCSVAQSCLTLWPHGLQYTRLPCPSPSPPGCSSSCPLSQRCYLSISSFIVPFSSCLQSFPASGSFPVSWLFASGDQSIGASASVLSMNIQGWFPLRLMGLISLLSRGFSRVFSSTTVRKHQFTSAQPSLWS